MKLSQKRSRRTMLMDMEREFEGYAKGVKSVMTAYNDGKLKTDGIHGPLAQLIKTDKKYIINEKNFKIHSNTSCLNPPVS